MVHTPEVALGIWLASDNDGVHDTFVAVVFVAIVPVAVPKEYVRVCVKEELALEMEIVEAAPISTEVADTEEALAILSSVIVALAVILS